MKCALTVTATAWFLFCPIYLAEGWGRQEGCMPVPRWPWLGWLLDLAVEVQQFRNWTSDGDDCCAGFVFSWIRPIPPKTYHYTT